MTPAQVTSLVDLVSDSQDNVITLGMAAFGIFLAVAAFRWLRRASN